MMFPHKSVIFSVVKRRIILVKNASTSSQPVEKWNLMCGICLERKPIITRPLNKLEKSFLELLKITEFENSQKSEFELKMEAVDKQTAKLEKKMSTTMTKKIAGPISDFEESSLKELQNFKTASRVTEADEKNDVKSTNRKLDKQLLFILNENIGKNNFWILPHDLVRENETLRQAAERILKEKCGPKVKAKFFGNAPCGFYKYKYPKGIRDKNDVVGAKIFFMKAQFLIGSVLENNVSDYRWASREELTKCMNEQYHKAVTSFLIDDESIDLEKS